MSPEKRRSLYERAEALRLKSPKTYKLRIALLVGLGYGYVGAVFLVLLLLSVVLVVGLLSSGKLVFAALALPVLIALFAVGSALSPRMDPPSGVEIGASDHPLLYRMLEDLRTKFTGPPIHKIFIDGDMNASIMQIPRLGIFGSYSNHLVLGLPLLSALSAKEIGAVIAHEYGHICGADGKFSAWIYRIRYAWMSLLHTFDDSDSVVRFVFVTFFRWYVPYFDAYSFALARANEYAADEFSVKYVGAKTSARALTRVHLHALQFDDYWRRAWLRVPQEPTPPSDLVRRSCKYAATLPEESKGRRCIQAELGYRGDEFDTHPPLSDRLEAMGEVPHHEESSGPRASVELLGNRLSNIEEALDKLWLDMNDEAWRLRHRQAQADCKRLDALEAKSLAGLLDDEEALEHANLILSLAEQDDAVPVVDALLQRMPENPRALIEKARLLANEGEPQALNLFDKVIASSDDVLAYQAAQMAHRCALEVGKTEEAAQYQQKLPALAEVMNKAESERGTLAPKEKFLPHGLKLEQLQAVCEAFGQVPSILTVWLVRRSIKDSSGAPIFVIGLAFHSSVKFVDPILHDLAQRVRLPGSFVFDFPQYSKNGLMKRLEAVSNSKVFHADSRAVI